MTSRVRDVAIAARARPDRAWSGGTSRPWRAPMLVAAAALVACVVVVLIDPTRRELPVLCPFRVVTGLDCPGCGATRAVYSLTRGDLLRAVDHNVLIVAVLPWFAWAWAGWLRWSLGRRLSPPTLGPRATFGLVGLIAVFWIARNLPALWWLGSSATWT